MQEYNFNFETQTLLRHFMAAFDEVRIRRYDEKAKTFAKEVIKVPMVFTPKSHILQDLVGKTDTVRLPIISVGIKSQGRDPDRIKNKLDDIIYRNEDGTYVNLKAIPWNIEVEMSILAKYQEDMDQIIENFSVYSNPYIVVSWQEPKSGREVRTEILWTGQLAYEYPGNNQTPKDPPFRLIVNTSFTIKGFLFRTNVKNSAPICYINTDYHLTNDFYCSYNDMLNSETTTETYGLTGRPVIRYVNPYYLVEGDTPSITINGTGLGDVVSMFVSGSNSDMYPLTTYKPFSASDSTFNGLLVSSFEKSDNTITFNLPAPSADGFVDIIALNSCGFGTLTQDAGRCHRVENPYPTTVPEHYAWCVAEFPFLNGLIVSDKFDPWCIDINDVTYVYEETPSVDRDALLAKIRELMELGSITVDDLA